MKRIGLFIGLMFIGSNLYASPSNSISVPNSFTPNTTIQSAQVNADFNEVQSKFNSHTHTDITSLGAVTSGSWVATAIGTTYGGTGQDFSAVAQGSLPYFSSLGTFSTLAPSTAGYVLQTNGAGANPSWVVPVGNKDSIAMGLEASASALKTSVTIYAGKLFHGTTLCETATTTVLTLSTAGNWSSGSTVTYGGGAGWNLIGMDNSFTEGSPSGKRGRIAFLGNTRPNRSDTSGNLSGDGIYYYDPPNNKYWRIIGAIRVNTSNQSAYSQNQNGSVVFYQDVFNNSSLLILNAGGSTTWTGTGYTPNSAVPPVGKVMDAIVSPSSTNTFYHRTGMTGSQGDFTSAYGTWPDLDLTSTQTAQYRTNSNNVSVWCSGYKMNIR